MTAPHPRSGDEIRAHLRFRLNDALRRPGLYGPETTLLMFFHTLAFAEGIEDAWSTELDAWREHRWFLATGVDGAVRRMLPGDYRPYDAVASVYATFAHRVGWLEVQRRLTPDDYDDMLRTLPDWVTADRTQTEVLHRYGPPSVTPGSRNPRFPRTWLYAASADRPPLFLDFWPRVEEPVVEEPVLLVARQGGQPFGESFWFTPEGRRRCPVAAEA